MTRRRYEEGGRYTDVTCRHYERGGRYTDVTCRHTERGGCYTDVTRILHNGTGWEDVIGIRT